MQSQRHGHSLDIALWAPWMHRSLNLSFVGRLDRVALASCAVTAGRDAEVFAENRVEVAHVFQAAVGRYVWRR
jgi:hypothetical protein